MLSLSGLSGLTAASHGENNDRQIGGLMRLFLIGFALALSFVSPVVAQETQIYIYNVYGRLTRGVPKTGVATRTTNYTLGTAGNRTQRATTAATSSGMIGRRRREVRSWLNRLMGSRPPKRSSSLKRRPPIPPSHQRSITGTFMRHALKAALLASSALAIQTVTS